MNKIKIFLILVFALIANFGFTQGKAISVFTHDTTKFGRIIYVDEYISSKDSSILYLTNHKLTALQSIKVARDSNWVTQCIGKKSDKQDKLYSTVNIKSINGQTLLGSGNITISGGSGYGTMYHDSLNNLDFASSGHTGFQIQKNDNDSIYFTFTERNKLNSLSNLDTTTIYSTLALKLNIADTANMLLPYFRKSDTTYWDTKLGLKLDTANFTATTIKNKLGISILSGDNTGDTVGHGILSFNTSLKQNRADTNTIGNPITLSYFNSNSSATDSAYIKKVVSDTANSITFQRVTNNGKTTTHPVSSSATVAQIIANGVNTLINKNYGDSSYFKIDQTTPQQFTNGIPLVDTTISITQANQITSKQYVDTRVSGGVKSFFFTKTASDVGGMYQAINTIPTNSAQTITSTATDGESINSTFIENKRTTPYIVLEGTRFFHITAKVSSTTKITQLKCYIYQCDTNGANPVLLRTSTLSMPLTTVDAEYTLSSAGTTLLIPITTRIKFVIAIIKESGGSDPTITVTVEDDSFTRLDVPSPVGVTDLSALTTLVGSKLDSTIFYSQDTIVKDPTGFINNDNIKLHYDTTNRTITLTGAFEAYWQGRKIAILTNGWTSSAHGTTLNKTYYLYYNGTSFIFDTIQYRFRDLQIAYVWYSASNKIGYNELHGCSMDWQSHELFHRTIGTTLVSGADISGVTLNSTTATNRRPVISAALIEDEDLEVTDSAFAAKSYCLRYLVGTGATRTFTMNYAEIIPVLSANPYYNQNNAGTWQQTLFANNNYGAIFVMAVPTSNDGNSQRYRFEFVQPQTVSNTLLTIQNLTTTSLNMGSNSSEEYIFIGKIIVRFTATDWIIISTEKLTGSKIIQTSATAVPYSATTDGVTILGNGTPASPLYVAKFAWTSIPDAPTRASATTFTITGDYTSYITKSLVIKWTESTTVRCAMVSASSYSSPNTTVTIIGDTIVSTGFDASSVNYYNGDVEKIKFGYAGNIGQIDTNIMNSFYPNYPCKVFGCDLQTGVAGSTNSTTFDLNKNWVSMFLVKPTLGSAVRGSTVPFTAIYNTTLNVGDKVTVDCDAVQSVVAQDAYIQLYIFPLLNLYKP